MGQVISEALSLTIGVANIFAHPDAFSGVLHLLVTRLVVIGGITLELVVLNALWPGPPLWSGHPNLTMNSPDHRPKPLGAGKGM